MAESVVSFLIDKLKVLLEEELQSLGGIRDEIVEVRDELERMKAFLRHADAMEDEDEGIRVWVKEIRELAFDTEDVIDEFLLRVEHHQWSNTYGPLGEMARHIRKLRARRQVASQLRQIKSRAVSISEGRQRYSHSWSSSAGNRTQSLSERRRNDARLVPEARLVGVERPKGELLSRLLEDWCHKVQVLAVQGMGGLGKTTLVNQVYRDDGVRQQFQHRAWITISQSFEEHEVLKEIIKQLFNGIGQTAPQETDSKDIYSLKEDIQSFLCDKKYLIVLDDVWDFTSWESLKYAFPDNNFGSHIVVTTRNRDVANFVTRDLFQGFVYPLKPLSSEESWNLFCGRVFQGGVCPPHLEEASRHILERCQGLPLAIVSISGVLATKDTSKEEWERVRGIFMADSYGNNQLSDMEKILSLSFNDLPYYLKSCFMCLTMFPEDFTHNKSYMIRLWIAEGFIQQMEDATQEEVGELYFNELLSRSLIQVAEEDDLEADYSWFHVHDIVFQILLRKSKNQNFATITSEQSLRVPEGVRRLSLCTTLEKLEGHRNLSRLGSLIFPHPIGSINSSKSMSEFLTNCGVRLLKVLDCSHLPDLDTFPTFITTQYNLRFLYLSDTKVTSIPHSIGRLRKLETLYLHDNQIEELPAEILQICGLRHLTVFRTVTEGSSLNTTCVGCRVPAGMGTLTSLQTLVTIQVNEDSGLELITSLGKLKQLRELHIQQLREEHGPILCSSIKKMSHLRILKMESGEDDEILDVQYISSPPPYLKDLYMCGRLMEIPSWVGKLQNLAVLMLQWSKLMVDPLESLQALPNLLQLYLYDSAYDGEELCLKAGGFQMLKKLWFESLGRLRRVTMEEGATPRLEYLQFRECKLMEKVPSGIEFLTNLKELHFVNMSFQFVTRLSSNNEDSDFQRLKSMLSLYVGALNAEGIWEPYL